MSNSVRPHRWQPTRLPRPWDSPGKNTGVSCHLLLQCMKVKSEREVAQSCPTLSDPMDCSPPGSSVHGIFQARVLEWSAIAFSNFVGIFTILWVYLLFFFYLWLSWGLSIVIYLYRVIFNWWSLNFKHFNAPTFLPSSSCSYWFWHHVLHLIILSIPQLLIVNKDDFTTFAF